MDKVLVVKMFGFPARIEAIKPRRVLREKRSQMQSAPRIKA
jgi:hypothetical protein